MLAQSFGLVPDEDELETAVSVVVACDVRMSAGELLCETSAAKRDRLRADVLSRAGVVTSVVRVVVGALLAFGVADGTKGAEMEESVDSTLSGGGVVDGRSFRGGIAVLRLTLT
jgi:hypothetical protein